MELFIHSGTEKTGSSFLQTLCAKNRNVLIKSGFYFPPAGKRENDMISGRISPGNAAELNYLIREENWKKVYKWLKIRIDMTKELQLGKLLLSNENLVESLAVDERVDQFLTICRNLKITEPKFLLIIRDPVDQALSLYKHRAKHGTAPDLLEWLDEDYNLPNYLFNFLQLFKDEKILIRKYSKDTNSLINIFFLEWLGIHFNLEVEHKKINPSLSLSELKYIKQLRQTDPDLVEDFYDHMLGIPLEQKSDESLIINHYKIAIENYLSSFNSVWDFCNELLPKNEAIKIPLTNDEYQLSENILKGNMLTFSDIQAKAIIEFQKKSRSFLFKNHLFYKTRVKTSLSKLYRRVKPNF